VHSVNGSCHCGAIQWEFVLPTTAVLKCHCGNCRKLQGADYSTWAVVPSSQHKITKGVEAITEYQANERSSKSFCSRCGSPVFHINGKHFPDNVVLALGSLNNYSNDLAPQVQVYTSDKADWVKLHDDEPIAS